MEPIVYQPIGVVHSSLRPEEHVPPRPVRARGIRAVIEVYDEYVDGLTDLEGFSHIVLLCHLHLSTGFSLIVKPPSDTTTHGVFATRSPRRPNSISLSVVRLERRDGRNLHVVDADLVDGTPVLDIKPYVPETIHGDAVRLGWMETTGEPHA